MKMGEFIQVLNNNVSKHEPYFGDGESALTFLYKAHAECHKMDDGTIKEDFNERYRLMNGSLSGRWIKSSIQSVPSAVIIRDPVL